MVLSCQSIKGLQLYGIREADLPWRGSRDDGDRENDDLTGEKVDKDWWMGQVINCNGAARAPSMHTSFRMQMSIQA